MIEPEYIMRFARAISPEYPELLLATSTEKSLLTDAAETIENLKAERGRLREALETILILDPAAEDAAGLAVAVAGDALREVKE